MNNYCTNCGKKLDDGEFECSKCHTKIIDIPKDYKKKSQKVKKIKKILKVIGLIMGTIILLLIIRKVDINIKAKSLLNQYIKPYIKENYNDYDISTIKFDSKGSCIESSICKDDAFGSHCNKYNYLDRSKCKAYYYKKENKNPITVFYKDGKYNVIEGKNIYGYDNQSDKLIEELKNEYVFPYIMNNYPEYDLSINDIHYDNVGRCIISGDCYFDPVMGCDGGTCTPYVYMDESLCSAYHFTIDVFNETKYFTVYYKDNIYNIVEGYKIINNEE